MKKKKVKVLEKNKFDVLNSHQLLKIIGGTAPPPIDPVPVPPPTDGQ